MTCALSSTRTQIPWPGSLAANPWQVASPTAKNCTVSGSLTKTRTGPILLRLFFAYQPRVGGGGDPSACCFMGDGTTVTLPIKLRATTVCCCIWHLPRHRGHKPGPGQGVLLFFWTLVILQLCFTAYWKAKGNWVLLSFISIIIIICEHLQLPEAVIFLVSGHAVKAHTNFPPLKHPAG